MALIAIGPLESAQKLKLEHYIAEDFDILVEYISSHFIMFNAL
jgi:hypothetical protein